MNYGKGICSICLKEGNLSFDHVPPKCCGNKDNSRYIRYLPEYLSECLKAKPLHSQNGIKFRTLCAKCNNDLGSKYDRSLMSLCKSIIKMGNNHICSCPAAPININKAVIGHLLATTNPMVNRKVENDWRKFYLDTSEQLPKEFCEKYSLFCFYYPYKESVFILRNFVSFGFFSGPLSCLYFYPAAFVFCNKQKVSHCTDFLTAKRSESLEIGFWIGNDGRLLDPCWPAVPSSDIVVCDIASAEQSVIKIKK